MKLIKTCLCFVMLSYCINSTAQIDTSTTQKLLQYIFQPIDKTQIPTGFLEEYGCPMLSPETFNGTLTDSNRIDMHLWRTLYHQLQTSWTKTTANPLPGIISVNTTIKQNSSSALPIPIPILLASYNTVVSNAFSSNLLSYNSSTKQVSDVPGRTQSPYNNKTLFAACPNKDFTVKGSDSFIIKSNMIWNNTGKTISQIQIDFANGQGFQTVTIGTAISVSYADTGFKKWTIKITLNDNSVLQCYNGYNVLKTSNTSSRYQADESEVPTGWGNINAVTGVRTAATVWVNYSSNNFTGTLRKPLIVVEGYDISFIAPSLQPGNYDINYFINVQLPEANIPGWDFNGRLDDIAGYDLVFVDFADGAADIVLNAGAVQEVINRVNANKVIDNRFGNIRQQNVVMGLSMGGLCARFALANMTKNFPGTPTETRLLITHDSPHKGANVPLGLQYMIRMLGGVQLFGSNVYYIYPDYDDAIGLLNAPATQQLLLYRATTTNTFAGNTFLNATYHPMVTFNANDPQPTYRFIATANGNECANQLFSPGKTFINLGAGVSAGIYARFLFFRVPIVDYKLAVAVEAYALPAAGSTNKIAKVYAENSLKLFGFINIFKQLYNNTAFAPGNHLAIDGVPGSNYPLLNVDALNQLTNLPTLAATLYVSFPLGPFLGGYFGVYAYNAGVSYNFTFVSTASALDASPYTTPVFSQKYVNGANQNYPSTSETFIAQETVQNNASLTNNVHIRFTARNSRWLFNEMENLPNTEHCSAECSNPFFIRGLNAICTNNSTYIIPGYPRGGSVTWSVIPSGIVSLTPSGSSVIVSKIGNGTVTLTAAINGCNQSGNITKVIEVGAPPTPNIPSVNFDAQCGTFGEAYALNSGVITGHIWNFNYGQIIQDQDGYGSNYFYINPLVTSPATGQTYYNYLSVQTKNSCGVSDPSPVAQLFVGPVPSNCSGGGGQQLRVSPNPTTTNATIETSNNAEFTQIKIINRTGTVVKTITVARTNRTTIVTNDLQPGYYRVQVLTTNNKWISAGLLKL